MNVVPTFVLLAILTLVAYRHVHAYRIAKRRRGGGGRPTGRQSTAESPHVPPCDTSSSSCCSPSKCLRYMFQHEKCCFTQDQKQKVPESPWPFPKVSGRTDRHLPYDHPPSSYRDTGPSKRTDEQELMARSYFGRYLFRRNQRPPKPDYKMAFPVSSGSAAIMPSLPGASSLVRSKRTQSEVCPSIEQWQAVKVGINSQNQRVEMLQPNNEMQWVLDERCQYPRSPILNNIACEERTRYAPAHIHHGSNNWETISIEVRCCVAMRID